VELSDLATLARSNLKILETPYGTVNAGLPFFPGDYGRDGIITAEQLLPFDPSLAKHILFVLASHQGQKVDPLTEEEPGRIFHEYRKNDFEILVKKGWYSKNGKLIYYGTSDATPLWLILFYDYVRQTNDWVTFRKLWPFAQKALYWIDNFGDKDGDGFIEYERQNPYGVGLYNQGWKDSKDAIKHKDGSKALSPIALVEVQAYVYQAKICMSEFYKIVGDLDRAEKILHEAEILKQRFNEAFWMPDKHFYALALDRNKKKVEVISSNVGLSLVTGIIPEEYIDKVVERLFKPDMFTKRGLRTLSSLEVHYDPRSYHNGSIWIHDNNLVSLGLLKVKKFEKARLVATCLLKACTELKCIPELFIVINGEVEPYYRACPIQAWSSGACLSFIHFLNKPR